MATQQRTHGFLPFGSDDPDVVYSASLKSAADLPAGATIDGGGAGSESYTEKGLALGSTDARLNLLGTLTTDQKKALINGGTITVWVEKEHVSHEVIPATTRYGFTLRFGSGDYAYIGKVNNTGRYFGQTSGLVYAELNSDGHPDLARLDIRLRNGVLDVYRDYEHVVKNIMVTDASDTLEMFYLGGRTASLRSEETYRFSNLQVSLRPFAVPFSPLVTNFGLIGDSFSVQAQNPSNYFANLGYTGTDYSSNTVLASTSNMDSAAAVVIHKKLAEQGVHVGGYQINGYGRTSCRVDHTSNTLADRTAVMFAESAGEYPAPSQRATLTDLACMIGANDAQAGVSYASYKAKYIIEIDKWIANGIQRMYLFDIIGRLDGDYEANIDALNVVYPELEALYPGQVFHVKAFDALGGHNIPIEYLSGDGLHPSTLGGYKLGEVGFGEIIQRVY